MATTNLTTADDNDRVRELFKATAVLKGLEAFAHETATDEATTVLFMSESARKIIDDVIATMNP